MIDPRNRFASLIGAGLTLCALSAAPACDSGGGGGAVATDTLGGDVGGGGNDTAQASGCGSATCPEDGLTIELSDGAGGDPPAGTYRITVLAVPEGARQCDFTFPVAGEQPACRVGARGLTWPGFTPSHANVILARDNDLVLSEEYDATYTTTTPNGPGCGPVCEVGGFELVVDH